MNARQFGRGLLGVTLILALYSVYWIIGRSIIAENFKANIEAASHSGYTLQHRGLSLSGFPFRFRSQIAGPTLTHTRPFNAGEITPSNAVQPMPILNAMSGDQFYYSALSFRPLSWRFFHLGNAQFDMRTPTAERWIFGVRPFQINGQAGLSLMGGLKSLSLTGTKMDFHPVNGMEPPVISLGSVSVSATPQGSDMKAALRLDNLVIAKDTWPDIQPAFGPEIHHIELNIEALGLNRLDDKTFEHWLPHAVIRSNTSTLHWGDLKFNIAFDLKSETENRESMNRSETSALQALQGWIKISLDDHKTILKALYAAGLITYEQQEQFGLALNFAPKNAQGNREITLTVNQNKVQFLGQTLLRL